MKRKVLTPGLLLIGLVSSFLGLSWTRTHLQRQRASQDLSKTNPFDHLPPASMMMEYLTTFVLGGLKPLAVNLLWMHAIDLQDNFQYYELPAVLDIITLLQPTYEEGWAFNAYNMVFNISRNEDTLEGELRWIHKGIQLYEKGIQRNPESQHMLFDLAFAYDLWFLHHPDLLRPYEKAFGEAPYRRAFEIYKRLYEEQKKKYGFVLEMQGFVHDSALAYALELMEKKQFQKSVYYLDQATAIALAVARHMERSAQTKKDSRFWIANSELAQELKRHFLTPEEKYRQAQNSLEQRKEREHLLSEYRLLYRRLGNVIPDALGTHVTRLVAEEFQDQVIHSLSQVPSPEALRSRIDALASLVQNWVEPSSPRYAYWHNIGKWLEKLSDPLVEEWHMSQILQKSMAKEKRGIVDPDEKIRFLTHARQAQDQYEKIQETYDWISYLIVPDRLQRVNRLLEGKP